MGVSLIDRGFGSIRRLVGALAGLLVAGVVAGPSALAQPANDSCANATTVGLGSFPFTTVGATSDGTPDCQITRDVWYRFTPPRSGVYRASTCNGTTIDTVMVVSTDNCALPQLIGCNDDSCFLQSRVTFFAEAGVPLLVRVGLWNNSTGEGAGTITISEINLSPTAFTYQGRLEQNGVPYTGNADMVFNLLDSPNPSSPVITSQIILNIAVVDGLFTVPVDFGDIFTSEAGRVLQVRVRPAGLGNYTTLSPSQPLKATPFARFATRADAAVTAETATNAETATFATTATTATSATNATNATNAVNATNAGSVPWTGITGIPSGFADGTDNAGPWVPSGGGITYDAGRVVIGTQTFGARVDVSDPTDANVAFLRSDNPFGTVVTLAAGNSAAGFGLITTGNTGPYGPGHFVIRDIRFGSDRFAIDSAGRLGFGVAPVAGRVINVFGGAHCTGTTWVNASSREFKTDFEPVDHAEILRKVASMPIASWSYKPGLSAEVQEGGEAKPVRHIGPTAEDFADAFGLGADASGISTVDQGGVALAAIQALAKENAELKARLERLERLLEAKAGNP